MASVEELAAHVSHGLALIATARTALAQGHGLIGEAGPTWGHVVEGTSDPDAAQLPGLADTVAIGIGECHAAATQAEQLLTAYLGTLGVNEPAGTPAREPKPVPRAERVTQARARVGRAEVAGGQAQGEWVRSDGSTVPIGSGKGDKHYEAAARFVAESNAPRPVTRLATHVEVKIAMAMRGARVAGRNRGDRPAGVRHSRVRPRRAVHLRQVLGPVPAAAGASTRRATRWDRIRVHRHRNGAAAMTLTASVPTFRDGVQGGESIPLATDADVTRLVELLAQPWADTGSIQTADTALDVHIRDEWGYLQYAGDAGYLITDGDPGSPPVPSEVDFPPGTGLPVDRVIAAVREFVHTGALPETVPWRDA